MTFAQWLRGARDRSGLTLMALAEKADISHSTVQRLENGLREPSRDMVEKLAAALQEPEGDAMICAGFVPREAIDYASTETEAEVLRLSRQAPGVALEVLKEVINRMVDSAVRVSGKEPPEQLFGNGVEVKKVAN